MKPLPLSKTYSTGSGSFHEIAFRDPAYAEYRQLGSPIDVQSGILLRDREVVFAYVDRLVTSPEHGALALLNLGDSMALEDHIIAFFIEARVSRAKQLNSSSASGGALNMSTD